MKTAILITAYKDFDTLLKLLSFYDDSFECYVHIDKKITVPQSFYEGLKSLKNTTVIQKYTINWGGSMHICAFLELLKMALAAGNEYFHLLPADAFPVKSREYIKRFSEDNRDRIFIETADVGSNPELLTRQRYYYFADLYDLKTDRGYSLQNRLIALQKKMGISRPTEFTQKGYLYCHLNREFAEYVLDYIKKNAGYFNKLKTCLIPEEFFFQNIAEASPYSDNMLPRHMIFDDWKGAAGGGPRILSQQQLDEALESDCLFARKVCSAELGEYVLNKL